MLKKSFFIASTIMPFLIIMGCSTQYSSTSPEQQQKIMAKLDSNKISGTDYRKKGKIPFSTESGRVTSASGCTVEYTSFNPEQPAGETLVLLGHGFFRSQQTQKQMAEHFASWGLHVATMDFCNSRPWNGHHDKNGADMLLVANDLNAKRVIYSGFSAGGLAAFLAAAEDERATAYLGLDMVDNFSKGLKSAGKVTVPVYGLVAEPSRCNAKNNGLDVYKAVTEKHLLKIHGASHCDFEFPYDKKCALVCGKTRKPYERENVQQAILGLGTSLLLSLINENPERNIDNWWLPDNPNNMIITDRNWISIIDPALP